MRIFVFRIAKGKPGGIVEASCPIDFEKKKDELRKIVSNTKQGLIPYETNGYKDYLNEELWQNNKLRQGWGIPGLDLRKGIDNWIENYLIGLRKYWNVSLEELQEYEPCKEAAGRFDMFESTIGSVEKGDIIIIPTHSEDNYHDREKFTIATVSDNYYFDLNEKYNDFGHVIPVSNQQSLFYNNILKPTDFTGYYQRAVTEIKENYKIYQTLLKVLNNNYFTK